MSKIYQKMYLENKSRSKGVLGGFIHKVILRSCNSESYPLSFKQTGFTLIELLVVVLIIGILAAVALPQYQKSVEKSRAAEAVTLVRAIAEAEKRYYMANGEYADDVGLLDISFPGESVKYLGTQAFKTKNFLCRPACSKSSSGCWMDTLATCQRLPQNTTYAIVYLTSDQLACRFYNEEGESVCRTFGTKKGSDYVF